MMEKEFSIEDIDIYTLLRDILLNLWTIALGGAVVAMLAIFYVRYTYVPEYRSQVTFVVSTKDATSSMYANLSTTIEMANIFTQIMDSDILKEKASQIAGYEELPGKIDAYAIPETNLLVVGVTAKSPEDAFKTLKLIIENYRLVSDYIYGNAHLEDIEDIEMSDWPVNSVDEPRIRKLSFLAGAFLSACAVCALSFFRDTVKNEKQANSKLDAKLLSTIRHERKYITLRQVLKRAKRTPLVIDMFASIDYICSYKKLYRLAAAWCGVRRRNPCKHSRFFNTCGKTGLCKSKRNQ
ncbi:MAG TPA: Wzz/FepE/Etk N-terminal domain-containing protein [Clostridia bacterium]|nr:Wzz/FepE/Etk N-terminal domain-containing protein [Clostridia bacterium]